MPRSTNDEVVFLVKPIGGRAREVAVERATVTAWETEFLRLGHAPSLRAYLALKVEGVIEWITHQDGRRPNSRKVA